MALMEAMEQEQNNAPVMTAMLKEFLRKEVRYTEVFDFMKSRDLHLEDNGNITPIHRFDNGKRNEIEDGITK